MCINYCCVAHSELLDVSGSVFLSCWMMNVQSHKTGSVWGALEDNSLIQFASDFLSHNVKLLSIFVHIIEEREPEIKDKVGDHYCTTFDCNELQFCRKFR